MIKIKKRIILAVLVVVLLVVGVSVVETTMNNDAVVEMAIDPVLPY
ncbi:hypothetical protein KPL39_02005 [Clostridium gasigenes]|nr:hypothetical protein [Clostridium gasigenes]MBU3135034.1 hypothetical protein [Clostridium gasigenes]